jgi:hypothetical protein
VALLDNPDSTLFPKLITRQLALLRALGEVRTVAAGEASVMVLRSRQTILTVPAIGAV